MMKKIAVRSALSCVVFLATLCMGQSWQPGDVFVAVGNGYQVWRLQNGTYAPVQGASFTVPLPTGAKAGFAGGCAFDSQFNFYATQSYTDANGNLAGQVVEFSNGTTISRSAPAGASSIVFDASGDFYVGSSNASVVQYRPLPPPDGQDAGANSIPISYTYDITKPIPFNGGAAQQLDLGTDQTSLFFTSANPNVKNNASLLTRLDLTNPSNNSITTTLPGTPWAVRLIAPGNINPGNQTTAPRAINGLLVADDSSVLKLNSSGSTALTFSLRGGKHSFRFLALDWDGQSVWVGDYASGNVYKVNIATMMASTSFATGSNNNSPMGGVCTFGGQQLNIVPLQFPKGTPVTRTAAFGDPQIDSTTMQPTVAINPNTGVVEPVSPNYHTWSATVNVVSPFTLVLSAIGQGPEPQASPTPTGPPTLTSPIALLDRFDEWFCNQAEPIANCGNAYPTTGPTLVPTPYADQFMGANNVPTVSGTGTAPGLQAGNRVVYRVENPPDPSLFIGDIGITVHYKQPPACSSLVGTAIGPTGFTSASTANCYTPPQCVSGTYVSNPRLMRDPSEGTDPNGTDYGVNHQFALDTTSNFLLDTGVTSTGGRNDHLVADRCPSVNGGAGFAMAAFNNPIPKSTVSAGSTVPIKITVTDGNGNPVPNAVTSPNNITIAVADQYGNLEEATAQSFGFFTQNGGAGGSYAANLDTTGLALGPTTICLTSVNDVTGTGTGTSGQFPPICTTFTIQ